MRLPFVLIASVAAALAVAGNASAVDVGVVDDYGIAPDNAEWFMQSLADLGMRENRISISWDPEAPTTIQRQYELEQYVALASMRGVTVIFAVSPAKARSITASRTAPAEFAAFLQQLARTFPTVKDYIIGNEPNQPRFWQPQFSRRGRPLAPSAYYSLLARSYDALKAVNPSITVIGVGLSPRGNDQPKARDNVSISPVRFISGLGKAYRGARRQKPIMDELGFHPYPDRDTDSLMKGYRWPNAGVPNLGRIKQAFWDAFRGTRQPTFGEGRSRGRLRFRLDELGWQVGVVPASRSAYRGRESVRTTNEAKQSAIYQQAIRYLACDASVRSVLFFLLRDEPDLERWQAGLVRADGSRRPSFDSVKNTVAQTRGRCPRRVRSWRHTTKVVGAKVRFPKKRVLPARRLRLALVANAEEDATMDAALYRGSRRVLRQRATVKAYRSRIVRFSTRFRPGRYPFRVTLRAALNPARRKSFSARLRIKS
ncbi:MAG TPA: hypothetical protein VG144_04525 [Gaiellaceae bacterium]|nr:hypothetical protein [Gaiellaceae bacterium]